MSLLAAWTTPPADVALFGQTPNRTLMAWVTWPGGDGWALEWKDTVADTGVFGFLWLSPTLHVQTRNATDMRRASTAAPAGRHHLCATYDGVAVCLYVDAVLANSVDIAGPIRPATTFLVRDGLSTSTVLEDVRVYDEALPLDRVALAMNTAVAVDPDPQLDGGGGTDPGTPPDPTASFVQWPDVASLMWR